MVARKILQPLITVGGLLVGLSVVAATLRRGPSLPEVATKPALYQASDFQLTLKRLNSQLAGAAQQAGLETAEAADNLAIARRLSLALVGSGMSLEEVRGFSNIPEEQQIRWWTSYLLQDQRWANYFAERLARAYVGTNDGPFLLFRRGKFNAWLSDQLAADTPYDQIVKEMLSAEGLWTDTPQVNFITATMDDANRNRGDPVRLAGRVSRAFLAQRIDCLQCHDDFIGNLTFGSSSHTTSGMQEHFHELAAFFAGTALPKIPFQGIKEDGRKYEFEFLGDSQASVVTPGVPFAPNLLPDAGKPRERLARWVTHPKNLAFSRATVNRVWALMFSRPLVEPVDNIPLFEAVPVMLDTLAHDFSQHGFDLKRLIRLIAESDGLHRASRADFEITPQHEDVWAAFPVTQLRPEQVAGSIQQACKLTTLDGSSSLITRLKTLGDSQSFLKRFGDRGEDEFNSEAVTISQRLVMMNGKLTGDGTKQDLINNASTRIATLVSDDARAVRAAYLATLNREPSTAELSKFEAYLQDKKGNARSRAVGDIYWAMINSTEFSWNH